MSEYAEYDPELISDPFLKRVAELQKANHVLAVEEDWWQDFIATSDVNRLNLNKSYADAGQQMRDEAMADAFGFTDSTLTKQIQFTIPNPHSFEKFASLAKGITVRHQKLTLQSMAAYMCKGVVKGETPTECMWSFFNEMSHLVNPKHVEDVKSMIGKAIAAFDIPAYFKIMGEVLSQV